MKVAALYGSDRLREGRAALARLAVALFDQGVHLVRVIPESVDPLGQDPHERSIALIPRIEYPEHVPLWLRPSRSDRVIERLERHDPDLVMACGLTTWSLAADCASALECPLVLELAGDEELARHAGHRAASLCAGVVLLDMRPTGESDPRSGGDGAGLIARRSPTSVPTDRPGFATIDIRPGVATPRSAREAFTRSWGAEAGRSLALVGGCHRTGDWAAVVDTLKSLGSRLGDWKMVVELRGPAEHDVWRLLRSRGLLDRTAPVADAAAVGALVRQCDLMIVVEPPSHASFLILEAMAGGMTIVAAESPWLPIEDGRTGLVVGAARPRARRIGSSTSPMRSAVDLGPSAATTWREALEQLLSAPELAARLGEAAADHAAAWHRASVQAEMLAAFCGRVAGEPALPFPVRGGRG